MTFQTENERLRVVCFSPDKKKRLVKYLHNNISCEISNVGASNNSSGDVIVNSYSIIKERTVNFVKDDGSLHLTKIDAINELELYTRVNINLLIVTVGECIMRGKLKVRETFVSDGEDTITLTLFGEIADSVLVKECYMFTNLSVGIFNQKFFLKSTDVTTVTKLEETISADNIEGDVTNKRTKVRLTSIDKSSMSMNVCCPNCSSKITEDPACSKLISCANCDTISLRSDCAGKFKTTCR